MNLTHSLEVKNRLIIGVTLAALLCAGTAGIAKELPTYSEAQTVYAVPAEGIGRIVERIEPGPIPELSLIGWNGYTSPEWELDLFVRLVQHESRSCIPLAWRYVADTVLNRLSNGRWGETIYCVMSATEPDGSAAFTAWKYVYGPQVELYDEIREVVMQSLSEGPILAAKYMYFSTDLPDWAVDAICVDGIWFYGSIWDEGGAT